MMIKVTQSIIYNTRTAPAKPGLLREAIKKITIEYVIMIIPNKGGGVGSGDHNP